jgi:hypothetical protein
MFVEASRDLWNTRNSESKQHLKSALARIDELKERRNRLVDALIDKSISTEAYQNRLDALEIELSQASRSAHDAVVDHLEIDRIIAYGQRMGTNLGKLWRDFDVDSRVQFQAIVFPDGIEYSPTTGFGTQVSCSIFEPLRSLMAPEESMVSPMGFEPMLSP